MVEKLRLFIENKEFNSLTWILAGKILCCVSNRQIHRDYRVLWRKRDSTATLSREECPEICLDRLVLPFWAHYTEDGPHLLCTRLL